MTKPLLIAVLISSSLIVACGGGAPEPASAPADKPAAPPSAPEGTTAGRPNAPDAPSAPDAPGAASSTPEGAPASKPSAPSAPNAPVAPNAPSQRPAYTRTDLQAGTGREAIKGKGLSVHYTGWLYDPSKADLKGRMFDSSKDRGPFDFVLGTGQVIPGWDQGFDGMKIGGKRRLIIPPNLAYGIDGAGNGIIPPNATLVFEMELLDVQQ
jgi:FKBP-type peptidyl-prolyl cis-trans isomerase FkpA